jgi:hypothetical protein
MRPSLDHNCQEQDQSLVHVDDEIGSMEFSSASELRGLSAYNKLDCVSSEHVIYAIVAQRWFELCDPTIIRTLSSDFLSCALVARDDVQASNGCTVASGSQTLNESHSAMKCSDYRGKCKSSSEYSTSSSVTT